MKKAIDIQTKIKSNGELVNLDGHLMHIYRQGNITYPTLVFMSGSSTIAPVYDFKVLYEKLANRFRIIVIEKFGYGYSDIYNAPCDIDSIVFMQKRALSLLCEKPPYILVSHSMSGLEAIHWKQNYPEDILAIIGLDMATPQVYEKWSKKRIKCSIRMMSIAKKLQLHRIPRLYPLSTRSLSQDEILQQQMLMKRNAFNDCYLNEAKIVLQNAKTVGAEGSIKCPVLLFSSDGKQVDKNWLIYQQQFAKQMNAKLICYNCGHYIHYFKSEEIANEIITFVTNIGREL